MPDTKSRQLALAVQRAEHRLGTFRENRRMFLKQFAGPYFATRQCRKGSDSATPLNMIYSLVSVILPHLASSAPRAAIRATRPELQTQAQVFSLAWNHLAREIDLGATLRTVVTDAMFGAGVIKVGLGTSGHAGSIEEPAGYLHDAGQPFADAIDLDDYIIDPWANDRQSASFEGNRYRVPMEFVMTSGLFNASAAKRLKASGDEDELVPSVELIDLWLPHEQAVVTIAGDLENPCGVLRRVPWQGPERGPYEVLGFNWAPHNLMPIPPVALVFDLHVMINRVARKIARQVDRQKDLLLFDEREVEEATRVRDAHDGEMVGVSDVDRYKQVSIGGPGEQSYRQLEFLFEQFNRLGANIDLLGGLGPRSNTLGQDEMLHANATIRIEDMRSQTTEFTRRVGEKLAWYLWYDPLIELPLTKRSTDGTDEQVIFNAEDREGDFVDYNFRIEPRSMSHDTPSARYRRIVEWFERIVLPSLPIAQSQGTSIDASKLARLAAGMLNIEEASWLCE